jgi:hypothetical protein
MAVLLAERVINLEQLMAHLLQTVDQTSMEVARLSREMREFKAEMRAAREHSAAEMREFKAETHTARERFEAEMRARDARAEAEMREFKAEMHTARERFEAEMRARDERAAAEMREFKAETHTARERFEAEMRARDERAAAEMREFKAETRVRDERAAARMRQMDKKWGEVVNRMGTLVEDMVAPSLPQIAYATLNCSKESLEYHAVRVKKRHKSEPRRQEFDVVVVCGDYLLINETKSKLNIESIATFVEKTLPVVRDYFPEYAAKKVVGCVASLYVDDGVLQYGERQGLIVLGTGQGMMGALNSPGFMPRIF